ncbi:MAG: family 16 glycosylhydrolase [Lewinellaceae bacterium]|nr:family 16 glycosylhydrolase [Saprospiraceae bacterium]MCB9339281.1 family 16 glycosylhydrolase [Lewinellaceae bacterium]
MQKAMQKATLTSLLLLLAYFGQAQCPDAFFCSPEKDVLVFRDSIPECEDIFDGQQDGFTDFVEFLGCADGRNWVTRFFRRDKFFPCQFEENFGSYNDSLTYQTVFFEDFEDDTLQTKYWYTLDDENPPLRKNLIPCSHEHTLRTPKRVKINDGLLHLETSNLDGPHTFICKEDDGSEGYTTRDYSTGFVMTYQGIPISGEEACFRYGKYSIRAKLPREDGGQSSFWMYGWGGEIDVFEKCTPDCNKIQISRYPYISFPHSNVCDSISDPLIGYSKDYEIGNLNKFREYIFEWTPHKLTFYVDGILLRTLHRYWRIEKNKGNNDWCAKPLECWELPTNGEFNVWEHIAWWPLDNKLDIFLSSGINKEKGNPSFSEFLVDWVKVEQKTAAFLSAPSAVCDTLEAVIYLENIDPSLINSWKTSPNLQIVKTMENAAIIKKTNVEGVEEDGWVEVNLSDKNCCFGQTLRKEIITNVPTVPRVSVQKNCNSIHLSASGTKEKNALSWEIDGQIDVNPFTYCNERKVDIPTHPDSTKNIISYVLSVNNECGETQIVAKESILRCHNSPSLLLYPNPATTQLYVRLENFDLTKQKKPVTFRILNEAGQILYSLRSWKLTEIIDIKELRNGAYILAASIDDKSVVSDTFIVQQ